MVVCVGELRQAIELLAPLGPLVDAGIQVDQVDARRAGGGEIDRDITPAVEAARVSHVRVVIRRDIDVVVLGPPDALQADGDWSPNWTGCRRYADDTGFDKEVCSGECVLS